MLKLYENGTLNQSLTFCWYLLKYDKGFIVLIWWTNKSVIRDM